MNDPGKSKAVLLVAFAIETLSSTWCLKLHGWTPLFSILYFFPVSASPLPSSGSRSSASPCSSRGPGAALPSSEASLLYALLHLPSIPGAFTVRRIAHRHHQCRHAAYHKGLAERFLAETA